VCLYRIAVMHYFAIEFLEASVLSDIVTACVRSDFLYDYDGTIQQSSEVDRDRHCDAGGDQR